MLLIVLMLVFEQHPLHLFMISNITHTTCEGPKPDAYRSSNVTSTNCQHDTIWQDGYRFEVQDYLNWVYI